MALDSEGLSLAVRRNAKVLRWLTAAWEEDIPVVTSAAILVEVVYPRIDRQMLRWVMSKVTVEPVTVAVSTLASSLLMDVGLHGHKYAIDAMLAATVLGRPGQVTLLTSDVDDMTKLLGSYPRVRIKAL